MCIKIRISEHLRTKTSYKYSLKRSSVLYSNLLSHSSALFLSLFPSSNGNQHRRLLPHRTHHQMPQHHKPNPNHHLHNLNPHILHHSTLLLVLSRWTRLGSLLLSQKPSLHLYKTNPWTQRTSSVRKHEHHDQLSSSQNRYTREQIKR